MQATLSPVRSWLRKDGPRDLVFVAGFSLFSVGLGLIGTEWGLIAAGSILLYISLFPRK